MKVFIYSILLFLGTVWCQNEIPEDVRELEKRINEVVPGIENFNQSTLEAVEETVRKKCEKNGGQEAFDKLDAAKTQLMECIQSNFNFTQIQEEIDKSRNTGSMDEVFAKYCLKAPIVEGCVKNLTDTVKSCLEEEEKSTLKLLMNITDSLANFVCYKDGDRIAMFVAEGGFECLQSKQQEMEVCANKTLGHLIPSELNLNNLPLLVLNDEGCDDYINLQGCVVSVLETCEDNTPANIIDALFKYIRRITPCKNHASAKSALGVHQHQRLVRSPNQPDVGGAAGLEAAFEQMFKQYEPHCLKNGGPSAASELQKAVMKMKNCSSAIQAKTRKSLDSLCGEVRTGMRSCLTGLMDKLATCSSREEAYVPKFGLELYDSVFGFYCKDDGRAIKSLLKGEDDCFTAVQGSVGPCLNKTKYIMGYGFAEVITKSELCGDFKTLRNCFLDTAAQKCRGNSNPNEFVTGLSDAVYAPCSGCRFVIINALIVLLFFIVKAV